MAGLIFFWMGAVAVGDHRRTAALTRRRRGKC